MKVAKLPAYLELSAEQNAFVSAESGLIVATGPAGTGKTTALQQRILHLLEKGVSAYSLLVLVNDPTQRDPFRQLLRHTGKAHAQIEVAHYSQLAKEMVTLFWPLIVQADRQSNSAEPEQFTAHHPPTFLGYDLAQLMMWRVAQQFLVQGSFANVRRRPQQIVSQLLDTLNRAALNRLQIEEATQKQLEAWQGDTQQKQNLEAARDIARLFRAQCKQKNLLDLSLTVEMFDRHFVHNEALFPYFIQRYRHILVDNVEEQTPAGQAFIKAWINHSGKARNQAVSAAVVVDEEGGYKRFLAANPQGAEEFKRLAVTHFGRIISFKHPIASHPQLLTLADRVQAFLQSTAPLEEAPLADDLPIIATIKTRYRRTMIFAVAEKLAELISKKGVAPREIAIIVPYLDGGVRYTLTQAFQQYGLPMNLVQRRATPREEPRVRAWLTWVALAHPHWGHAPTPFDVAEALALSIGRLDPPRATLLTRTLYNLSLESADNVPADIAERIGAENLARYEELRLWLVENRNKHPLDQFLFRLFDELLVTPRFQPTPDLLAGAVCEWLLQTATRLQEAAEGLGINSADEIGRQFLEGILQGVMTSQPPEMGDPPDPEGITISTIYGYLLRGSSADYQVWLESSATGWWDIPRQPLSNAFVISAQWSEQERWTMYEEIAIRNELLGRIIWGLATRCRRGVILAVSDLDRRGQQQDGALWRALQAVLPKKSATILE